MSALNEPESTDIQLQKAKDDGKFVFDSGYLGVLCRWGDFVMKYI